MNATTFAEFRASAGPAPQNPANQNDDKMDQIRELVFGDYQRQTEARFAMLEVRIRELELAMHHRLDGIQGRVELLAGQAGAEQRAAFDELARSIADLGERVRRIR